LIPLACHQNCLAIHPRYAKPPLSHAKIMLLGLICSTLPSSMQQAVYRKQSYFWKQNASESPPRVDPLPGNHPSIRVEVSDCKNASLCYSRPLTQRKPTILAELFIQHRPSVALYMIVVTYFFLYRVVTLVASTPFLMLLVAR